VVCIEHREREKMRVTYWD